MKTQFVFLLLVLISCFIIGCQKSEEDSEIMSGQEKEKISKAVKEKIADYVNFRKQNDIENSLNLWADTEEFVFAGDGLLMVGYDLFATQLRDAMSNIAEVTKMEYEEPHVYVLSKDAASLTLEYEWSVIDNAGNVKSAKGSWNYVFKKFDEDWKVVHSTGTHLYE